MDSSGQRFSAAVLLRVIACSLFVVACGRAPEPEPVERPPLRSPLEEQRRQERNEWLKGNNAHIRARNEAEENGPEALEEFRKQMKLLHAATWISLRETDQMTDVVTTGVQSAACKSVDRMFTMNVCTSPLAHTPRIHIRFHCQNGGPLVFSIGDPDAWGAGRIHVRSGDQKALAFRHEWRARGFVVEVGESAWQIFDYVTSEDAFRARHISKNGGASEIYLTAQLKDAPREALSSCEGVGDREGP